MSEIGMTRQESDEREERRLRSLSEMTRERAHQLLDDLHVLYEKGAPSLLRDDKATDEWHRAVDRAKAALMDAVRVSWNDPLPAQK